MTTAREYLAPLITAYHTALAGLPVAQQAAVQCSIGIEVSDSHERWQLTADGAEVTVTEGIAEVVDFRVYANKARIEQFINDNGISFLLRPITTGALCPSKPCGAPCAWR